MYGFLKPGLKTDVGYGIFWSEIGSGLGDAGGTPSPKIPRSTPPGKYHAALYIEMKKGNDRSSAENIMD